MLVKKLRIKDIFKEDAGKGIARVDPSLFVNGFIEAGNIICIRKDSIGKITSGFAFPSDYRDSGTNVIRIDALLRRNLHASIDDVVEIQKARVNLAQQVSFAGYHQKVTIKNPELLAKKLHNRLATKGDIFSFREKDRRIDLVVINHTPKGSVVKIHKKTAIYVQ